MFMNKRGQRRTRMGGVTISLVIAAFLAVGILGFMFFGNLQQTQISPQDAEETASSSLIGKAATLAVSARDASADDITTRRTVPVYIQNPDGEWIESGGTSTSTTTSQAFTSGLTVSNQPYKVLAFNNTHGSPDGAIDKVIKTESESVNVNVYTVTDNINMQLFDRDGNGLSRASGNISLSAGQTDNFEKLRIENNATNTGYVLFGIYVDLQESSNLSTMVINSGDVSLKNGGASGTLGLQRVTNDDLNYALEEPKLLYEFDRVETGSLVLEATGTDVTTETYTLYAVDGCYYYSSKGEGVKFGAETDAASPADVCASDFSIAGMIN